jgi:hypothetical protein
VLGQDLADLEGLLVAVAIEGGLQVVAIGLGLVAGDLLLELTTRGPVGDLGKTTYLCRSVCSSPHRVVGRAGTTGGSVARLIPASDRAAVPGSGDDFV